MSFQDNIKNIIFFYIKKKYNEYLEQHCTDYIDKNELEKLIDQLYIVEKDIIKKYIRDCLKDMYSDNYNSTLVETIILEIFDDEELAKNRVILEIQTFQQNIKKKNIIYTKELIPDKEFGVGLQLDFTTNEVIVANYKRKPDNSKLEAELQGIKIGDSIICINNNDLENKKTQEKFEIVKKEITKSIVSITFKTYEKL
jgi:hypothetical protein